MRRWSFTKFSTADHCHRQFQARYKSDGHLPEVYEPLREAGKAVHACIERYKSELVATRLPQDLSIVPTIVEEYFGTDPEVVSTECYADVLLVFGLFAKRYRHDPATFLGAEFMLERELPESDILVEVWPDHVERLVDNEGPIVVSTDVKSGYSTTVTADNKLQGEMTAWALLPMFEGERVGWRVSWPRNESESPIEEFKPSYAQSLEARLRTIVRRADAAEESGFYRAQPGSACAWCLVAANCEQREALANASVIAATPEDAEKAASDLVLLEAAYNQRREQVKAWAQDNGPVLVGDMAVGFRRTKGGDKIGDIGIMLMRLGLSQLLLTGVFDGEDDPRVKTEEGQNLIAAAGAQVAIQEELIAVNGNKTKAKKVKDDPRLAGIWVPGDSKTQFALYKTTEVSE